MAKKILLVNPPVYDFTAYDFWLKPYGVLSVGGYLRGKAEFSLFDFMDRLHPFMEGTRGLESDEFGRGRFYEEKIAPPECFKEIPRYWRRTGLPRKIFAEFLQNSGSLDYVFIQTVMTYWYQGAAEVIEDIRRYQPQAKIVLGGNYATLCPQHAKGLGADFVLSGVDLRPLWDYLQMEADYMQPSLWELYPKLETGVMKLTDGCAFNCTYCSVPQVYKKFIVRPAGRAAAELKLLLDCGVKQVAFYDDALLHQSEEVLIPFLQEVISMEIKVNFHTPNALNARFVTLHLAELMVEAGFKTFFLGFESKAVEWQNGTGGKIYSEELVEAVKLLKQAGAIAKNITTYQIIGHPGTSIQEVEESMRFVNSLGIRCMLADFSPIPGTPDGEYCRKWVNMDEPLMHNKTVFPIILLGNDKINYFKQLHRDLNRTL